MPTCQSCTTVLPEEAAFCTTCGNAVNGMQKPGYQPPQPTVAQTVPVQQQQTYAQPQQVVYAQPQQVYVQGPVLSHGVLGHGVIGGQMLQTDGRCAHAVQTNDFTVCGIVLAIVFFPIGLLCCLVMTERRCVHCGALLG